jgi:hypothetical protein
VSSRALALLIVGVAAIAGSALAPPAVRGQGDRALRAPGDFAGIPGPPARSAALFVEAGKVIQHPRCLNCHPVGNRPSQGTGHPHQPPVERGPDGFGVTAMRCQTCHQAANFDPGRVPGHPEWHLAPASMGWQGRTLAEICAQMKDRARNRNRSLDEIVEHMSHDTLVGWAWSPGADRAPPPGSQAAFGALVKAWVDSGAACPAR